MSKKVIVRTALCAALIGVLGYSFAAKSETKLIPFQGKLTDASGQVISDGAIVVQFKMYDAPVGGQAKWNGEVQMLSVNGGLVNTTLGTKASLKNVDFSSPTYLEITIDANGDNEIGPEDPPLLPRQCIVPAVYAVEAGNSKTMGGHDWSSIFGTNDPTGKIPGNKLADKGITATQIKDKTITAQQMADSTITGAKIAKGTITSTQLANGAMGTGQIADGAITTAKLDEKAVTTEKIAKNSITTELMGERKMVIASETAAPVGSMAISKTLYDVVGDGYSFNTVKPNYQQIPGMSVKLKTSGRPVMVMLQRGHFDIHGIMEFQLWRDGTDNIYWACLGHWTDTAGTTTTPSSIITYVDFGASAGEHEYSLRACKHSSNQTVKLWGGMYLLAFEL